MNIQLSGGPLNRKLVQWDHGPVDELFFSSPDGGTAFYGYTATAGVRERFPVRQLSNLVCYVKGTQGPFTKRWTFDYVGTWKEADVQSPDG
jgi:hypothetical protein